MLLHESETDERVWALVHCDIGALLLGCWYKPPASDEIESIRRFEQEYDQLSAHAIGTVVMGDVNVHNKRWLTHSSHNSAQGTLLREVAGNLGL